MGCVDSKVESETSTTKGKNGTEEYDAFNSQENVQGYSKGGQKDRRTTLEDVVTNAKKQSLRSKKDTERLKKLKIKIESWRTADIEKIREQLGRDVEWWAIGPKLCIHKPVPLVPESNVSGFILFGESFMIGLSSLMSQGC
jgi:hypothetical protein